jgi:hypothetical protein
VKKGSPVSSLQLLAPLFGTVQICLGEVDERQRERGTEGGRGEGERVAVEREGQRVAVEREREWPWRERDRGWPWRGREKVAV